MWYSHAIKSHLEFILLFYQHGQSIYQQLTYKWSYLELCLQKQVSLSMKKQQRKWNEELQNKNLSLLLQNGLSC